MRSERPSIELSPREKQLLDFAAEGLTDTAIANKLGISEATVGTYWGRVRIKLGPYSRTELVAIVLKAEQEAAVEQLRRENEELVQKLQSEATAGASFYHDLLENAPDALILVGEAGVIEMANSAACDLFGYEHGELEGADLTVLVPPRLREIHRVHRADYIDDPTRREMGEHLETPAVKKDGTEFRIRAALSAINSPTGLIVTCAVRPVK
jgi:PAS domain S-box-containing protein